MARTSLPPGFRFHPTDVELVKYYLKRKVLGKKLCFDAIAEVNIYDFSPWDLPDKSFLRSGDLEWYFFSPKQKKYAKGVRTNRATESGYWKATGKDRVVLYNEVTAGLVKTLIFHLGHPPKGERTNWVMHEYSISDKGLLDAGVAQDSYVICKIFQKSGLGPKNGAQYGAPFCEKDWDLDDDEDAVSLQPDAPPPSANESVITASAPGGSTTSSGPSGIIISAAAEEVPYSLDDALPLIDNHNHNHNHNHPVGNPNQFLDMVMEDNAVLPTTSCIAPSFSGSTYAGGDVDERGPPGAPSLTDERQPPLSEDELDRLLGMFTDDIIVPGQGLFGMPCGFWDDGAGPSRVVVPSVDEVAPPPPPGKPDDDDNEINYLLGMFKEDDCSLENMFGSPFL